MEAGLTWPLAGLIPFKYGHLARHYEEPLSVFLLNKLKAPAIDRR